MRGACACVRAAQLHEAREASLPPTYLVAVTPATAAVVIAAASAAAISAAAAAISACVCASSDDRSGRCLVGKARC